MWAGYEVVQIVALVALFAIVVIEGWETFREGWRK